MKDLKKVIEEIIIEVCRWVDQNDGDIKPEALDKGIAQMQLLLQEERKKTLEEVVEWAEEYNAVGFTEYVGDFRIALKERIKNKLYRLSKITKRGK